MPGEQTSPDAAALQVLRDNALETKEQAEDAALDLHHRRGPQGDA